MRAPSDRELVLAAQQGEVASLGALLERHEAGLLAHALRQLRDGPAARDAVQETFVVAVCRIGDVREPEAARAWLHAVLCNVVRMGWRAAPPMAAALDEAAAIATDARSPEEELDRAATCDWLWTALVDLPEPLRLVVMLRHFGTWSSYAQIAEVLDVPVGTVRSRLSVARERLAASLAATAEDVHTEARAHRRQQEAEFRAASHELNAGTGCTALAAAYAEDVRARFQDGTTVQGRPVIRASLEEDLAAGTRLHVVRVVASGSVTVVEADLESPPDDPLRCPPSTCQVHLRPTGTTSDVHVHFAPRRSVNAPASVAG